MQIISTEVLNHSRKNPKESEIVQRRERLIGQLGCGVNWVGECTFNTESTQRQHCCGEEERVFSDRSSKTL